MIGMFAEERLALGYTIVPVYSPLSGKVLPAR